MSINIVILQGNLGGDPEMSYSQDGSPFCRFTIATGEKWTDKEGVTHDKVEWHKVIVSGGQAEPCGKYLKKGSPVCVEGKVQTRKWEDKSGVSRETTQVKAKSVRFLGGAK